MLHDLALFLHDVFKTLLIHSSIENCEIHLNKGKGK